MLLTIPVPKGTPKYCLWWVCKECFCIPLGYFGQSKASPQGRERLTDHNPWLGLLEGVCDFSHSSKQLTPQHLADTASYSRDFFSATLAPVNPDEVAACDGGG